MAAVVTQRFVEADASVSRRDARRARRARSIEVTLDLGRRTVTMASGNVAGEASIVLVGELDIATTPLLAEAITLALHRRPERVSLDARRLTFMDAGGVGLVVGACARLRPWGGTLIVVEPVPAVRRVLALCGLGYLVEHLRPCVAPPSGTTIAA